MNCDKKTFSACFQPFEFSWDMIGGPVNHCVSAQFVFEKKMFLQVWGDMLCILVWFLELYYWYFGGMSHSGVVYLFIVFLSDFLHFSVLNVFFFNSICRLNILEIIVSIPIFSVYPAPWNTPFTKFIVNIFASCPRISGGTLEHFRLHFAH